MRRQTSKQYGIRRVSKCLLLAAGSLTLAESGWAAPYQRFEDFTLDPSWDGVGNRPPTIQNYGWSQTDFTGNTAPPGGAPGSGSGTGELGGTIIRNGAVSYYGRKGSVSAFDPLSVSGVYRPESGTSSWYFGWFNSTTTNAGGSEPRNFIGVQFDDSVAIIPQVASNSGRDRLNPAPFSLTRQENYQFMVNWDPNAGPSGHGQITGSFTGLIAGSVQTKTFTLNADSSRKPGMLPLTHFGMFPVAISGGGASVFFDDLTFTTNDDLPPPTDSTWDNTAGGNWNTASNWVGGVPQNVPNTIVRFLDKITQPSTVFTDGGVMVGGMQFNNANTYLISGAGSLTLAATGSATVEVLAGSHKINLPLFINSNTTATVASGATLKISDPVTIAAGKTLTITPGSNVVLESTVTVGPAAAIALGASSTSGSLVSLGALSMASDSKLDISNNAAILGNNSIEGVQAQVKSAYNGGAWNGAGITSSSAASDSSGRTGIGIGQIDGSSAVMVKHTYYGDANLDGVVTSEDFAAMSSHFNSDGSWMSGDFNYDGKVNALDFNAVASNFGAAPLSGAGLGALVPEPASLSLLAGIALAGLRRRRA